MLAAALAGLYVAAERDRLGQAALRAATATSRALDLDLAGLVASVEILSLSPALRAGDLDAFDAEARQVRERLGVNVAMRDRGGQQLVNTRLPRGAALPRIQDFASDRRVAETGQPDISDLIAGATTGTPLFVVNTPLWRDGAVSHFLNFGVPPARVRQAIRDGGVTPGWSTTVLDRNGVVLADLGAPDPALGQRLQGDAWWRADPAEGLRWMVLPWQGEDRQLVAHVRSALSGWTVMVAVPARLATAPLRQSLAGLGALVAALLGLSAGLALLFARRIASPVARLAAAAQRLGQGEPEPFRPTGLREVDQAGQALADSAAESHRRQAEAEESAARLRLALEAAGFGRWEVDTRTGLASRAGHVIKPRPGLPLEGYPLEHFLREIVHPEDAAQVRASFDALLAGRATRHRTEYRAATPDGAGWIWVESYGGVVESDPATGAPIRISGVSRDISDRKAAEAQRRILLREIDHRAKNALAVAQSIVALTRADDPAAYAKEVNSRIAALARAHTRLAAEGWAAVDLRDLLADGLRPFGAVGLADQAMRIGLAGDPVALPGDVATPVAMVMHELATNAAKHGALSVPPGRVEVAWTVDGTGLLHLRWTEHEGPPATPPAGRPQGARGFGSRMIDATIRHQLAGDYSLDWTATGLRCRISIPLRRAPSQGVGAGVT